MARSVLAAAGAALLVAGCGASGGRPPGSARIGLSGVRPAAGQWLRFDPASRRAQLTLVLAYNGAAAGLNIDGASKGALLFSVPAGWRVTVRCVNRSTDRPYSCVLGPSPGFRAPPGTNVLHPAHGLPPGGSTTFAFASQPGVYRLGAVTAGVEPEGMWVVLQVTAGRMSRPYARWLR